MALLTSDTLMTPAEVAKVFFVDPKTVTRWANSGKLPCIRTGGGHRRFYKRDVYALLYKDYRPRWVLGVSDGITVVSTSDRPVVLGIPMELVGP